MSRGLAGNFFNQIFVHFDKGASIDPEAHSVVYYI